MILRNNSDLPEKKLDQILRFVDPDRLLEEDGEIVITTNQDDTKDEDELAGLFISWGGPDYDGQGGTAKIVIFFRKESDTVESLVFTLAHEFRHMWQWHNDWDLFNDKELSEKDACVYDELMFRLWIRGGWNWRSLVNIKHEYVPISEEIVAEIRHRRRKKE